MAIDKTKYTPVLVNFPDHVLEEIETYQFENRIKSRTKAIIELIENGLEKEQSD